MRNYILFQRTVIENALITYQALVGGHSSTFEWFCSSASLRNPLVDADVSCFDFTLYYWWYMTVMIDFWMISNQDVFFFSKMVDSFHPQDAMGDCFKTYFYQSHVLVNFCELLHVISVRCFWFFPSVTILTLLVPTPGISWCEEVCWWTTLKTLPWAFVWVVPSSSLVQMVYECWWYCGWLRNPAVENGGLSHGLMWVSTFLNHPRISKVTQDFFHPL